MVDFVFGIMPRVLTDAPLVGPYILKAVLEQNGYSAKVIDYNIRFYNFFPPDQQQQYWVETDDLFDPSNRDNFRRLYQAEFKPLFESWVDEIVSLKPKFFGMSLLSNRSYPASICLASLVRERAPEIKIVVGGPYAKRIIESEAHGFHKFADYIVAGDAEESILALMREDTSFPGVNSLGNPVQHMDEIPFPSYDIDTFSPYDAINDEKLVYVTGSRGCVNNCGFCTVRAQWPKFQYRSGERLAQEILRNYVEYGRTRVRFTDSLVNGSTKAFREMCTSLADYRRKGLLAEEVHWAGQFVCRPLRSFKESDYELVRDSGGQYLIVGLESGSEKVRRDMNKYFSNADFFDMLKMMQKYDLSLGILLIVGYPTETEKDFQQTIDLLKECADRGYLEKNANGIATVGHVSSGPTMLIGPDMPVYSQLDQFDIEYHGQTDWTCGDNSLEVRIRRHRELVDLMSDLGFSPSDSQTRRRKVIEGNHQKIVSRVKTTENTI